MSAKDSTTQQLQQNIQFQEEEIWKPVHSWEGIYEVSNLGRIKRVCIGASRHSRTWAGRILKLNPNTYGYTSVVLANLGRKQTCTVHGLVAIAFIGPRPMGMQVNHKDGVKSNCRSSNLEYLSGIENARHAWRIGLFDNFKKRENLIRGENHPFSKLTEEIVKKIRHSQENCTVLGKRFRVSRVVVWRIRARKTWKHI